MKIILNSNENVLMSALMNTIDPQLEEKFVDSVTMNPLIDVTIDENDNTVYEINEEYIIGTSNIIINHSDVVVPLCKSLYAAVRAMASNVINFTKDLITKHIKRNREMRNAEREYEMAKEKLRKAKVTAVAEDIAPKICRVVTLEKGERPVRYRVNLKKDEK